MARTSIDVTKEGVYSMSEWSYTGFDYNAALQPSNLARVAFGN